MNTTINKLDLGTNSIGYAIVNENKYTKYKDSGIDWLGKIPRHWECKRLGNWFVDRRQKVSDKDFEPLSVTKNGIVPQLESAAKSNDGDNRKLVRKGDFVINSRSDRKGSSGLSPLDGSVSLINIVMKPRNVNGGFINHLLKSNGFIEEFYRNGHGIVADLWTTRFDEMKFIHLAIPPISEQKAIAAFLDEKCGKIDELVSVKEQQITLLKERRQVVIHEAVTKGIKPDIEMRDSGINWIGEIPSHWEVKRFSNIFSLGKGLTITKQNLQEEGVLCVNYGEIHSKYGFELNPEIHQLKYVDESYLKESPSSLLQFGDFIFADTSEDIKGSGNFTYLNSTEKVFAGYHTVVAKPFNEVNSRFLAYEFDSSGFRSQIQSKVKGVKVYSITQNLLKDLSVWIPPFNEQKEIVAYLEDITTKIDQSIVIKTEQIAKLKEYKQSLINEVVTGKVKVC